MVQKSPSLVSAAVSPPPVLSPPMHAMPFVGQIPVGTASPLAKTFVYTLGLFRPLARGGVSCSSDPGLYSSGWKLGLL